MYITFAIIQMTTNRDDIALLREYMYATIGKKMLNILILDILKEYSDEIFVVNPGGYIGDSTWSEICYSYMTRKKINSLVLIDMKKVAGKVQMHIRLAEMFAARQYDVYSHLASDYPSEDALLKDRDMVAIRKGKITTVDPWVPEDLSVPTCDDPFPCHADRNSGYDPFTVYVRKNMARFVEEILMRSKAQAAEKPSREKIEEDVKWYCRELNRINKNDGRQGIMKEEKENAFLDDWAAKVPGFIRDGIVNHEYYWSSKIKLLFLLKEANGGANWDLRRFLQEGGRKQTWDNVARWVIGINDLERDIPWTELENVTEAQRIATLQQIAVVNVKKTSGGHTSLSEQIAASAINNGEMLRKQINMYQPDIIICGGTSSSYFDSITEYANPDWKQTKRGIWYVVEPTGRVVIEYSHPEARVKDCLLYYGLVDAVRETVNYHRL